MQVAVEKVGSYSYPEVEKGLTEVLRLIGGLEVLIKPGDRVLIKPNMLEGLPPDKGVTTHPEVLRAVIRQVKAVGAIPSVGDSPGVSGTLKAADKCGISLVCQEEGVELVAFDTSVEVGFPEGLLLKKFSLAEPVTKVDKVISLAKMKTHTFMGVTGATKNMFGCIVGMQKAQFHLRMQRRQEFSTMLLDLAQLINPVLSIVDGIVGMEGNGPRNGTPIKAGVLMAGINCFAVDMVMAQLMGFKTTAIPLLTLAVAQGHTPALANIQHLGSGCHEKLHFAEPHSLVSLDEAVPKWLAKFGRNQLTSRPHITANCISCGRCVNHCPPQAMTMVAGKVVIDYDKCIRCYCCQELCPENAVALEEGKLLKVLKLLPRGKKQE